MLDTANVNDVLLAGAKEVFETMIFIDLQQATDPNLKLDGDCLLGSITFTGNIDGCLGICCTINCARIIAANMLGMGPDAQLSADEVKDAIGEVTNMVMGTIKSRMTGIVGNLLVSIPTVVTGRDIRSCLCERNTQTITANATVEDNHLIEFSLLYTNKNSQLA
jgi:chemotaxis protein CheX